MSTILTGYDNTLYAPVLWDDKGNPVSLPGTTVAPAALNYATLYQYPGRVLPYRSDEALRDSPLNALAMRRRAFYARLMQERTAATVNRRWQVKVQDELDPRQAQVRDGVQESWDNTPDRIGLIEWLLEAVWYGKSGSQLSWGTQANGKTGVVYHEPVNGDGILFTWDGCPVIMCSHATAQRYQSKWPADVLPPGKIEPLVVGATERGAWGLVLRHPSLRRRFIVHKHRREAADYYEGELAGGLHGVGLRGKAYWTDQMLVNSEQGMMNFLFSTGMMDLLVFNYLSGNNESRTRAQENAEKITGKIAILNPCTAADLARLGPVTQIPMNVSGVSAMQGVVQEHFGKQLEHLFVGQSMSTGEDGTGSLGGSGKAEFAANTKSEILKTDTNRLGETLSTDWAIPARDYLFPGSNVRVWMEPVVQDDDKDGKQLDAALKILPFVAIEADELREKAGFRKPREGRETVGGQAASTPGAPGANGLNPALPAGHAPGQSAAATTGSDPAKPNPVLPAGTPDAVRDITKLQPNSVLPPGDSTPDATAGMNPVDQNVGTSGQQPTPEQTADGIAELIGLLNAELGLDATADRDAILAAVQQHMGGVTQYAKDGNRPAKFSSTQINLEGEAAGRLLALAAEVEDADLADDGREDKPHVTVKYGLHTDKPSDVFGAVRDFGPVVGTLTRLSAFRGAETGNDHDVIFAEVDSPDLHRLNAAVATLPHTDTYPTYHPHATVAYVKAGLADKYLSKWGDDLNIPVSADRIAFSNTKREHCTVVLTGPQDFPVTYELDRASDGRFGKQAGQHKGKEQSADPGRATTPDTSPAGQADADPLAGLTDHAAELSDPQAAEAARSYFGRVRDKVNEWALRVGPHVLAVAEALFDTPQDMVKFGYNPATTGPTSTADAASHADPVKAHLGISAHLAMTIASKVLAAAWVKGKRAVGYDLDADGNLVVVYVTDPEGHEHDTEGKFTGPGKGARKKARPPKSSKAITDAHAAATEKGKRIIETAVRGLTGAYHWPAEPLPKQIDTAQLARRLAVALRTNHDADPADLEQLHQIIAAHGMKLIGTAGETVPFDGASHETDRAVSEGQAVRVVAPGLETADQYRPLKAKVVPA